MKKEVGLWVDHRKAVIVTIENEVEVTREKRAQLLNTVEVISKLAGEVACFWDGL